MLRLNAMQLTSWKSQREISARTRVEEQNLVSYVLRSPFTNLIIFIKNNEFHCFFFFFLITLDNCSTPGSTMQVCRMKAHMKKNQPLDSGAHSEEARCLYLDWQSNCLIQKRKLSADDSIEATGPRFACCVLQPEELYTTWLTFARCWRSDESVPLVPFPVFLLDAFHVKGRRVLHVQKTELVILIFKLVQNIHLILIESNYFCILNI